MRLRLRMSSAGTGEPAFILQSSADLDSDLDAGTIIALVLFIGTSAFCAVLACLRPRMTFCSMNQKAE